MGRLRGHINKGPRIQFPDDLWIPTNAGSVAFGNSVTLDGAGEYAGFVFDALEAKEISSFLVRTGSAPTDSAVRCSLNNVDDSSTTLGAVKGTELAGANVNFSAVAINTSMLVPVGGGLAYTPAAGQMLMYLLERGNGAAVFNTGLGKGAITYPYWITQLGTPGVQTSIYYGGVKCTDGTWIRIPWTFPISAIGTTAPTSTGVNEVGMKIVMPQSMMVDRITSFIDINRACEVRFSIRDSARVSLRSVIKRGAASASIDYGPKAHRLSSPVYMRGGKTYYVTAESMNANALGITYLDAFDAEAMKVFLGNEKCLAVTRDNDTDVAFTEFTTRKYFLGVEGYAVG